MINAGKNKDVDNEGIRLAPQPLDKNRTNNLPPIRQEFIIEPVLDVNEPETEVAVSTAADYQPKKVDTNKRWKRGQKGKNIFGGIVMLIVSMLVILPYILGACHVDTSILPFKYAFVKFDVVNNLIEAFKVSIELGWTGAAVGAVWQMAVPSIIILIGLLFVLINILNSLFGIFGAIKPRKYIMFSFLYLLMIVALFIAALVGAEAIGIPKMDFMQDFIYGFKSSEMFTLMVFGIGNFIISILCQVLNPERSGYTR
ncbi:MAG: hypothetical protein RR405_02980 [Clostridia bacterium]